MENETTAIKGRKITIKLPGWETREVPTPAYALARSRTEHLTAHAFTTPIADLTASAYLQGLEDAYDAFTAKGMMNHV